MSDDLLAQLKSPDPSRRRQAIIALGRSGDVRALKALADVARNDPVPALRQLAVKAGRYIKRQTQTMPALSESALEASSDAAHDDDAAVSYVDSSAYYDDSLHSASISGQSTYEVYYPGEGEDSDHPYDAHPYDDSSEPRLRASREADPKEIEKRRQERKKRLEAEIVTWNDALIDLALMFLVMVAGIVVAAVVPAALRGYPIADELGPALQAGLAAGLGWVVFTVIRNGVVYVAGVFAMGGSGGLPHVYHAVVPIETGGMLLVFLVFTVGSVLNSSIWFDLGQGLDVMLENLLTNAMIVLVLAVVCFVLFYVPWAAYRLSKALEFGYLQGLGTLLVGWSMLACLWCCYGIFQASQMQF